MPKRGHTEEQILRALRQRSSPVDSAANTFFVCKMLHIRACLAVGQ